MVRLLIVFHFCCFCACFYSCNKAVSNREHASITDSAIAQTRRFLASDPKRAIVYIDSIYRSIPSPGPMDLYKKYNLLSSYYYEKTTGQSNALKYADSIVSILSPLSKKDEFNSLYAMKLLDRGDILFRLKRFNEAYLNYYKGRTVLNSANGCDNPLFYYGFYSRLANVSYGQSNFKEAIKWHQKAINSLSSCGLTIQNAYEIQGSTDNIALCYVQLNQPDSALSYYNNALGLIKAASEKQPNNKLNFEIATGVILGNQGSAYNQKGDFATAEQKYKQSIAINARPGYATQDALITKVKLAEIYLDKNDLNNAQKLINEVSIAKDTLPEPQDKLQFIMTRAIYAQKLGDITNANKILHEYIDLMYAIKKSSKQRLATDFGNEFEHLNRQYEIQAIKKDNQLKNIYLLIAILVLLMGAAIIYLLLKAAKRIKRNEKNSIVHNRQLESALNALENSSVENTRLLSLVAHDLKNPIHAIYGITAIMTGDDGRTDEDLEMLELIKVSSKNMDDIIKDLLSARINSSAIKNEFVETDLGTLLSECVSLLQYRAKEKKLKIVLMNGPETSVLINRERIWRVINNLLVNAIKFSHRNTQIMVGWATNDMQAIITVADSGIGIPKDLSDKIFELSGGAKREGTSGEETFGLGLFISKQIIEEHNGRLWFESKEGIGTTFYFSLPLHI